MKLSNVYTSKSDITWIKFLAAAFWTIYRLLLLAWDYANVMCFWHTTYNGFWKWLQHVDFPTYRERKNNIDNMFQTQIQWTHCIQNGNDYSYIQLLLNVFKHSHIILHWRNGEIIKSLYNVQVVRWRQQKKMFWWPTSHVCMLNKTPVLPVPVPTLTLSIKCFLFYSCMF